jgi:hypothetical protein
MVNDKFLWVRFFFLMKPSQGTGSLATGVPKRPYIDENNFLQQVCYLSSHIICCTLTDKWANPWEPLVYSCIVWVAPYANLVQGTAGSQWSYVKRKSLTDFQVFGHEKQDWPWYFFSVWCAHFSTQISICLTPAHQILPSCQWFMFNVARIARPHDHKFFCWLQWAPTCHG